MKGIIKEKSRRRKNGSFYDCLVRWKIIRQNSTRIDKRFQGVTGS